MIAQHQTVYNEDLTNRKIKVTREFDAPVDKVWKAWTDSNILDKWWAPKPWKAVTKSMDFREGGKWLYYMQGPEGERHHCICEYGTIDPQKRFTGTDAFTDEQGNISKDMPRMDWDVNFREEASGTLVEVIISFASEEAMKQTIEMGFKDGFAMAHGNLDELLAES
jgi:uncharacterized protein YndB with AHSA1/START domain